MRRDNLESFAMARASALIRFRDAEGLVQRRSAALTDIFAQDGSEYLVMNTGETVRLDHLLAVDDFKLADY